MIDQLEPNTPVPVAATPAPEHSPPSLPASPHHKKTKVIDERHLSVASILNDEPRQPTPTPSTLPPPQLAETTMSNTLAPMAAPSLQIKLLSPSAKAPTRGSAHAAGYDIYASTACTIPARSKALVSTSIAIAVPEGTYGRIAPRSGLASKHFIDTGAGVIDADYRGEVKVLLFNFNDTEFAVNEGDRVAQLILERIVTPEVMVVEELADSVRGAGGFGSTGGFGAAVLPAVNGA
ncbi:hypothetical protein MBLNU457_7678t2 [Dothideomycetes sp. NU457]